MVKSMPSKMNNYIFILFCIPCYLQVIEAYLDGFQDVVECNGCCQQDIEVNYGSVIITNGMELTPKQVRDEPAITFDAVNNNKYTLIKIDPDAPSRANPTNRYWRHWLVVNIPGNDVNAGDVITPYLGAGPPQGTGLHRYIFLVYQQMGQIDVAEAKSSVGDDRKNFDFTNFARKHDLGSPIACIHYISQYQSP